MKLRHALLALAALGTLSRTSLAQECASAPSEWVFCDDFESTQDQDGNLGLWDDQGLHPPNLVVTSDASRVHSGSRSLEITAHKGSDTGGGPAKWFLPGYDAVHVRFWVRFSADYNYPHHMVFVGANEASNQWSAFGTAGCRPSGSNFFTTSIEPFSNSGANAPPGAWGFYTYSVNMQCDPGASCSNYADPQQICNDCATKGSPCNNGPECCWGANNMTTPAVISPRAQWVCVEALVEANSGGASNGSQTLWIDDAEVGSWSNIQFRTDDALKINSLGLWHYVTDDVYATGQTEETVWFDDVVVSTAKIGCGASGPGTGGSGGAAAGGSTGTGAASSGGAPSGGSSNGGSSSGSGGSNASGSSDDGGCGCRSASGPPGRGWFLFSVALGALVLLRRRTC